jgi:hypothetical protein
MVNTMTETSQQAQHHAPTLMLRNPPKSSSSERRPILTHLNADNSWLVSLPQPSDSGDIFGATDKAYYHILLDAWLGGEEVAIGRWFRVAEHTEQPVFHTAEGIDRLILQIEASAHARDEKDLSGGAGSEIDLIVCCSQASDHMHKETLTALSPKIPVRAVKLAAVQIEDWNHFETVTVVPEAGAKETSLDKALPPWLKLFSLFGLVQFGMLIAFASKTTGKNEEQSYQAIFHTPHGVCPPITRAFLDGAEKDLDAPIELLAMTHPLQSTTLAGMQVALGAHNGLKLQRMTKAKYWIRTHGEAVIERGVIAWLVGYQHVTFDEALQAERAGAGKELEKPIFVDIANGESFVLE